MPPQQLLLFGNRILSVADIIRHNTAWNKLDYVITGNSVEWPHSHPVYVCLFVLLLRRMTGLESFVF